MPQFIKIFLESASYFGNNILIVVAVVASAVAYFAISGFLKEAFVTALSGLSFFYSVFLKNLFKVPRLDTYVGDPGKLGDVYRFPSSHVIFYVCFWGLMLFLSYRKDVFGTGFYVHIIRILSIYHILFVGVSRILLGAYTIQDVIAGYLFGLLYLGVLIFLIK